MAMSGWKWQKYSHDQKILTFSMQSSDSEKKIALLMVGDGMQMNLG